MKVKRQSARFLARKEKQRSKHKSTSRQKHSKHIPQTAELNSVANHESEDSNFENTPLSYLDNLVQDAVQDFEKIEYNFNLDNDTDIWQETLDSLYISKRVNTDSISEHNHPNLVNSIQVDNGVLFPNFNIVLENDSIKKMKKFDQECSKITWYTCKNCSRSFPDLILVKDVCKLCIKHPLRWTKANKMDPGIVPPELTDLTDIETMVIAQVHTVISIRRFKGSQYIYNGNIINFPQNINDYVRVLPHIPSSLPYLLVFHRTFPESIIKCIARPEKIRSALLWLKKIINGIII